MGCYKSDSQNLVNHPQVNCQIIHGFFLFSPCLNMSEINCFLDSMKWNDFDEARLRVLTQDLSDSIEVYWIWEARNKIDLSLPYLAHHVDYLHIVAYYYLLPPTPPHTLLSPATPISVTWVTLSLILQELAQSLSVTSPTGLSTQACNLTASSTCFCVWSRISGRPSYYYSCHRALFCCIPEAMVPFTSTWQICSWGRVGMTHGKTCFHHWKQFTAAAQVSMCRIAYFGQHSPWWNFCFKFSAMITLEKMIKILSKTWPPKGKF